MLCERYKFAMEKHMKQLDSEMRVFLKVFYHSNSLSCTQSAGNEVGREVCDIPCALGK